MQVTINRQSFEAKNVFFTSDYHLNHDNIIRHCNRPFRDTEEMDSAIIDRCNELVGGNDILFNLGDFCFHNRRDGITQTELAARYRNRLACKTIFFVWGNHDKRLRSSDDFRRLWRGTYDILMVEAGGKQIVLSHYPYRSWERSCHGSWNLYGHDHGEMPDDAGLLSFDVGVDCWDFRPVVFEQALDVMSRKTPRNLRRRD